MKEVKAPDKVTQKMTRDGAVAENLATGEVTNISSREPETDFSPQEEPLAAAATESVAQAHKRRTMKKRTRAEAETVREDSQVRKRPSSRLQFTDEERADPALQKYIRRSDKAADKLDAAKETIPTKKVLRTERTFDEAAGKGKMRLHFEEVEKTPNGRLRQNPLSRPIQEIGLAAHNEVHKVEHENVGVEAGHKGEELAERGVSYAGSKARAAIRYHRMKPWRDAAKAEQAAIRANADFLYQKALHDDPALAASNPVSRYLQKKHIQRSYAKEVRNAEKTAKNTAATAKSAAKRAKEAVRETAAFVKSNWKVILIVIGIAAIILLLIGGISSCSMMVGSGVGGVFFVFSVAAVSVSGGLRRGRRVHFLLSLRGCGYAGSGGGLLRYGGGASIYAG